MSNFEADLAVNAERTSALQSGVKSLELSNEKRRKEISSNRESVLLMQSAIEETRSEVHTMGGQLEDMKSDISDIKNTAHAKAVKDDLFQVEVTGTLDKITKALDSKAPKAPEPFKSVMVSQFVAKKPLYTLAILFMLVALVLSATGQAQYIADLWQPVSQIKVK